MKYQVEFIMTAGSSPIPFNFNELSTKMYNHINLFNNYFGVGKWAYTGSSALAIYTGKYRPEDLSKVSKPNDLDIIFVDNNKKLFNFKNIGEYSRPSNLPVSYATFVNNQTNEKLDLLIEKVLHKIDVEGIPLVDINIMYKR